MHKVTEWFHRLQDVLNPYYNSVHKLKAFGPFVFDTVFLFAVLEYFVWYSKVLDVFMKFGTIMQYGSFGFAFIAPFSLWLPFPTIKIPSFISLLCWES